ncbi:MAG: Phosphoesterase family protein [Chthoniobacteraceae bacterium]|nr:Phosphoesterase family protein [Chthoniobacteraceae bacterium]
MLLGLSPLRRAATWFAFFVGPSLLIYSAQAREPQLSTASSEKVGRLGENRYQTPTNQIVTPAGMQVELPRMRPQAIALSPDGKLLVTSGKSPELIVIDPKSGKVLEKVAFPGKPVPAEATSSEGSEKPPEPASSELKPDNSAQLSFTGLTYSPDGSFIYLSNVNGDIKVFKVDKEKVSPLKTISLPDAKAPKRKQEIPAGIAVSRDGKLIYVAGNLSNKLLELDVESGQLTRSWNVGVAPFDVALANGKAYVSNWGGRRPAAGDLVGPAGRGTVVRVDPVRHIANEGSVSVIDLKTGMLAGETLVELHASALAVTPDEKYVAVANAGSDTISVIDTKTNLLVEKIWTREPSELFGASPNALAFDKSGKWLMVCNGTQNAVGLIKFDPANKESKLVGLVPVGWFPGAIVHDAVHKQMCVANIKGIGAHRVAKPGDKPRKSNEEGENSKDSFGTLSLVPIPDEKTLAAYTGIVGANMRHAAIQQAKEPPRPAQPARPVPERAGEPSLFKHVVYIIKENRTYDQVLGDVKAGNGDAALCTFGEKFTPNQHKLVKEFVLLDNTYCSGIQSADGHQWTDSAITTDYVERSHASWPRSYMSMKAEDGLDALAYSPAGFLWDNAIRHKISIRNYGEACVTDCGWTDKTKKGKPTWKDYLTDLETSAGLTAIRCKPGIASLQPISKLDTVGWDLGVPDVIRADRFIAELKQFEQKGVMPQLIIMLLPNDHTAGTNPGKATPAAMVADNDLAFGRIIEALSKSKFWPGTCLFAIEDDPQAGWDHVSGYRTTAYVASPYTKRGQTISTQYNQTSVVRTIELILGLPPMNIMDASATPMTDCFSETPNLTPFVSVPNQHPIDELAPEKKKITDRQLLKDAIASAKLNLREPDKCPEDLLNRILWRSMKGTARPYPAWAVTKVDDDD